jgi:hypothetical protein
MNRFRLPAELRALIARNRTRPSRKAQRAMHRRTLLDRATANYRDVGGLLDRPRATPGSTESDGAPPNPLAGVSQSTLPEG